MAWMHVQLEKKNKSAEGNNTLEAVCAAVFTAFFVMLFLAFLWLMGSSDIDYSDYSPPTPTPSCRKLTASESLQKVHHVLDLLYQEHSDGEVFSLQHCRTLYANDDVIYARMESGDSPEQVYLHMSANDAYIRSGVYDNDKVLNLSFRIGEPYEYDVIDTVFKADVFNRTRNVYVTTEFKGQWIGEWVEHQWELGPYRRELMCHLQEYACQREANYEPLVQQESMTGV